MKKRSIAIFILVGLVDFSFGQSGDRESGQSINIGFSAGRQSSFHYNPNYSTAICFECSPERQGWIGSYSWDINFSYSINQYHRLNLLYGFSKLGFYNVIKYYPSENISVDELLWTFRGLELSYQCNFNSNEKSVFYFKNGIRFEKIKSGEDKSSFNPTNTVFTFRPGVLVAVTNRVSVNLNGLFKTAWRRFNTYDEYKNHYPFSIGIEAGVEFTLIKNH